MHAFSRMGMSLRAFFGLFFSPLHVPAPFGFWRKRLQAII
jgi:hypothetical protein